MSVIICNPGFGNGPFLRCLDIACALRKDTARRIVVPLFYGERQRRIIIEEYGEHASIECDATLGDFYAPLLYTGDSYARFLERWLQNVDSVSTKIREYVLQTYGEDVTVISRSPVAQMDAQRGACSLFARQSMILERAIDRQEIAIDRSLLRRAAARFLQLEESMPMRLLTQPGTFEETASSDVRIPLTADMPKPHTPVSDEPSLYVSTSGIPQLTLPFDLGMPLYSNNPEKVPGSAYAPPGVLGSDTIVAQVARPGWGAIWNSLLTETPLLMPPYDAQDDPEIFFNTGRVAELGFGMAMEGLSPQRLRRGIPACVEAMQTYKERLLREFGTLNGARYAAEKMRERGMDI